MTAIHGYIKPSRRAGELGIHSVDHFHFAVPDPAVAQKFYGEFGLDVGHRFARALKVAPQTVSNYLSNLAAIFAVARPAWGYPLDRDAMRDAFVVAKKLGLTAKARQRERRPTLDELDRILEHFGGVKARRPRHHSHEVDHCLRYLLDTAAGGNSSYPLG
jgi:hypothetical protein